MDHSPNFGPALMNFLFCSFFTVFVLVKYSQHCSNSFTAFHTFFGISFVCRCNIHSIAVGADDIPKGKCLGHNNDLKI